MHIQTHILSGWCVGNLLPLSPRERVLCMIAASAQDLDGLGIIVSEEWYWALHHRLGHSLLAGVVLATVLACFAQRKVLGWVVFSALFHLHLAMDYFGSGPEWEIHYLWPFDDRGWESDYVWPLFSWQNIFAFGVLLAWAVGIAYAKRRTPLEVLMPSLDRRFTRAGHISEGSCSSRQTADAEAIRPAMK
jgi:inner membrane protein